VGRRVAPHRSGEVADDKVADPRRWCRRRGRRRSARARWCAPDRRFVGVRADDQLVVRLRVSSLQRAMCREGSTLRVERDACALQRSHRRHASTTRSAPV